MKTMSVIVPVSWGKAGRRLDNCLASVQRQNGPFDVEIIVVWVWKKKNAKHRRALKRACKKRGAKLVEGRIHGAWRPSYARNIGFRASTGGILCCLDADAVLHPGTLACVYRAMRVQRKTVVRAPTRMKKEGPRGKAFQPGALEKTVRQEMRLGKMAPGPGSLIAAPREAVFGIRGRDERYVGYGPADWDYFWRLVQWGCRKRTTAQEEKIYAIHQFHKPRRDVANKKLRERNRKLYRETKKGKNSPVRNKKGWGGQT